MVRFWNVVFAVVLVSISASAQQITGNIRGTVSDPSGAVVQNASVTAHQVETGLVRTATTDRSGNYLLLELPVGHYRLEVTATGFQKYLQDGISLDVNETAAVPIRLAVGSEKELVQVRADAELIQPTVTSLGQVVHEREILDLPLDGRNFSSSACCNRESFLLLLVWKKQEDRCVKDKPMR
jgi:Carboxypeptidase regulatory-like domain